MKKFLFSLIAILFVPMLVFADGEENPNNNLVKVYIFEAGGCSACEAQLNYLQQMESYNQKFQVVVKELYVDNKSWALGADYELGQKVVNYYKKALGFNANYNETPLVVISDLYASNGANPNLESVIDKAYEEGDKDIVACLERDGEECQVPKTTIKILAIVGVLGVSILVFGAIAGFTVNKDNKDLAKNNKDDNKTNDEDNNEDLKNENTLNKEIEIKEEKENTNNKTHKDSKPIEKKKTSSSNKKDGKELKVNNKNYNNKNKNKNNKTTKRK